MRAASVRFGALIFVVFVGGARPCRADEPPPAPVEPAPAPGFPAPEPSPPEPAPEPPLAEPVPAPEPHEPSQPPQPPEPELPAITPDVITLENGSTFEGAILEETADQVVLEMLGSTGGLSRVTIARSRISTIVRGDGRTGATPGVVTLREAWFLLRSGGDVVGTRHEVLRSLRVDGKLGFRLEETIVQLPQGRRIPGARFERVEDTDASFLPRRMHYRESVEPLGEEAGLARFERSVSGSVEKDIWSSIWRRGADTGRAELALPAQTRGVLGLRELLLRSEREPGLARTIALDVAENRLQDLEVGFAAVAKDTGGTDELHWVLGGQRRITRYRGNEVDTDLVAEGVTAVATTEVQARAVESAAKAGSADPKQRDLLLPEQGLQLTLPGPDWTSTRSVSSSMDAGRRVVARLSSPIQLAEVRIEWDPEGFGPGATEASCEAALLERLKAVCPDLAVAERRRPAEGLAGAWRLGLYGTLRDTPVRTLVLVVPRGKGLTTFLAAVPDASWEGARPALEKLLSSVRPL